jgi:hypothetical protein
MNHELTGKLIEIYDTQKVSDKFQKREFVVELQEEMINGRPSYPNFAKMQLVQAKCDILDRFKIGDTVKVSFNIKGNRWERDGKVNYITNLDAWRIESAAAAPNNTAADAAQTPSYNNAGGNATGNNFNTSVNFNPSPETIDDLPF